MSAVLSSGSRADVVTSMCFMVERSTAAGAMRQEGRGGSRGWESPIVLPRNNISHNIKILFFVKFLQYLLVLFKLLTQYFTCLHNA